MVKIFHLTDPPTKGPQHPPSPSLFLIKFSLAFLECTTCNLCKLPTFIDHINDNVISLLNTSQISLISISSNNYGKTLYIHIHTIHCNTSGTIFLITWHTLTVESTILIDTHLITWSINEAFIRIWKQQFIWNMQYLTLIVVMVMLFWLLFYCQNHWS